MNTTLGKFSLVDVALVRDAVGHRMTPAFEHTRREGFRPFDRAEEPSYSIVFERASRFLAEVLSACFSYGFNFAIQGNDNHEGYIYSPDGLNRDQYYQIQDAMTPATIAEATAEALADALADAMNTDVRGIPIYFVQVCIENGKFLNAHTGIVIAENTVLMAEFLIQFHNVHIEIVNAYD